MLLLSGIQHYMFCPRQWALIHVEQLWADNLLTADGSLKHKNVDNPKFREKNNSDIITLRSIHLYSSTLGLKGVADAIEILPESDVPQAKKTLLGCKQYIALPIEYKRGHKKANDCDRIQVAAQAIIIEEMLGISIEKGAIFYWEERHRELFDIDQRLRTLVFNISDEMHLLSSEGRTPAPNYSSKCRACSLNELCSPKINKHSASKYNSKYLYEETT